MVGDRVYDLDDVLPGYVIRWRDCPWVVSSLGPIPEADITPEDLNNQERWRQRTEALRQKSIADAQRRGMGISLLGPREAPDPWHLDLDPLDDWPPALYAVVLGLAEDERPHPIRFRILGPHLGFGGIWSHDWEALTHWPRVPVCRDCGLLWPCPDDVKRSRDRMAEMDAARDRCERCSRILNGCMAATVGKDDPFNPDAPGKQMFCGRKGPCLNAAKRAAADRGLQLVKDRGGWSWTTKPLA